MIAFHGSHTIQVNANDNAGNIAEASTTFIVKPLPAIVEIEPHTLNINSSGRWIQAKIQIPEYSSVLIDISSIKLNAVIPAEIITNEIEDGDDVEDNYNSGLKVKFNRIEVQNIVSPGIITLYISGKVNGAAFLGSNAIEVIDNQKMDLDKENKEYETDNKNKGGKT